MSKEIVVGSGPGEIKMEEIFTHAVSGDHVKFKRINGFHTLPAGMNVPKNSTLTFTGAADDRIVKVSAGITVYGELTLDNMTIDFGLTGSDTGERIYVAGGVLNLKNVTVLGSERTISPVLVDGGVINIDDTEVLNRAENGYGVDIQKSAGKMITSHTNGISLDGSVLSVTDSSVLGGMQLKENAELTASNTKFNFTDSVNPRNIICTDSKMKLFNCEVKGDKIDNPIRAFNSNLELNGFKIGQVRDNGFGVEINDHSEAVISNSDINGLYIKSSRAEVIDKSTISGFFELFESSTFKALHLVNQTIPPNYTMMLTGGSAADIEYFESSYNPMFKVTDSNLKIDEQNVPDENAVTAEVYGDSKVTGENIKCIEYDQNQGGRVTEVKETYSDSVETAEDAMASLDQLVGLDEVKRAARKFINVTNVNKKKEEQGIPVKKASLHSMFLGNPGTGKTTVARLIGKILSQNGVLKNDHFVEVSRQDLVSGYIGKTTENTLEKLKAAHGGVFFVDEAYTLNSTEGTANYGQEALDTILKYMEDYRDDIMIIFAGYTKEMFDFMNMNPGLKSRVPHSFDFEDYTVEQLVEIGVKDLELQHYQFDHDRYHKELLKAYRRSTEGSNARFVRNFNEKLVMEQSNRVEETGLTEKEDFLTINDEDWDNMFGNDDNDTQKALNELLEELNRLVGLENVKAHVTQLVKEAQANKLFEERGMSFEQSTYHMVFAGPPGTGKTTVARLISKIFCALDILSKDTLIEVDRGDLVGSYIGHSEKNTNNAIERAMGGVLFIDEAYQLTVNDSDRDFGHQVVDTLITALENHRDQFITIFAGYTNDMERFLEANDGLKSRIPYKIEFDEYSSEEVAEIVIRSLSGKWRFNEDFLRMTVTGKYDTLPDNEKSNGRWARNFTQKLLMLQKNYIVSEDVPQDNFDFITDKVIYEMGQMNI